MQIPWREIKHAAIKGLTIQSAFTFRCGDSRALVTTGRDKRSVGHQKLHAARIIGSKVRDMAFMTRTARIVNEFNHTTCAAGCN